jgi:hypothetical protein
MGLSRNKVGPDYRRPTGSDQQPQRSIGSAYEEVMKVFCSAIIKTTKARAGPCNHDSLG